MSEALDILKAARELLADQARWTQHSSARDRLGRAVPARNPDAVCWCAYGACQRQAFNPDEATGYLRDAATFLFGAPHVASVNDGRGHAAVLRMYDHAIELAEAKA